MKLVVVLGDQLFDTSFLEKNLGDRNDVTIFMREDSELCTRYRFHKHKLIFFLSAMRTYAKELSEKGFKVHYEKLGENSVKYEEALRSFIRKSKPQAICHFEIEDAFLASRFQALFASEKIPNLIWPSPMFLTSHEVFDGYLKSQKKPFMKTFYERQRKRMGVLVDKSLKPVGGQWSFDEDNRKSLPEGVVPPRLPEVKHSLVVREVTDVVNKNFADHPGDAAEFWLPVDRKSARSWLQDFLEKRLAEFGPYEDALTRKSDFVFHSVLTPFLNTGLLTPDEVISSAIAFAEKANTKKKASVPLNSLEGFIRQVIGWREFIRGIYHHFGDRQVKSNFFNHSSGLTPHWYAGNTGIQPLDDVIKKTLRYGYAHHIERLMVVGSLMLLLEVHPDEAYRWFMEMFIDSADWVMVPNVYGMALFSDGGIFATKPYICGSNYYRKMGGYKSGDWTDGVDGLYWSFIEKNRSFFSSNPRLSMMVRTLDRMPNEKKSRLAEAAHELKSRITTSGPT